MEKHDTKQILDLLKKMFIGLSSLRFGRSLVLERCVTKCASLNNQPCQSKPTRVNINYNEPLYYPFNVSVKKCGRRCNAIDDPYAQIFVTNKVKNVNVKVLNLISRVNEKILVRYNCVSVYVD